MNRLLLKPATAKHYFDQNRPIGDRDQSKVTIRELLQGFFLEAISKIGFWLKIKANDT